VPTRPPFNRARGRKGGPPDHGNPGNSQIKDTLSSRAVPTLTVLALFRSIWPRAYYFSPVMRRPTRPANLSARNRLTNSPAPLLHSPASQVFSSPTSLTFSAASQSTASLELKPSRPFVASTHAPTPRLLPTPLVEPRRRGLSWVFKRCCINVDDSDACESVGPVLRERSASAGRRSGAVMVVVSNRVS